MPFQCNQNVSIRTTMLKRCSCSVHIGWAAILCTVDLEEKHARNLVSGLPSEAQARCLLSLSFTSTKLLSSVSLKYLQSGLQRLSVSFRYFLFFFTCGEKWGVCLFWKILTKGSESFGTGFQSPDSPALVVLSPYRCWANCNYQWEPTLTHLLSKKGILLFGGILMQWLQYS